MAIRHSRFVRVLATTVLGAAALAGCAGGGSSGESASASRSDYVGIVGDQSEPGTPTQGGTVSFATYSAVASLDPAVTPATGPTGGTELAAVYDVLVRYDIESGEFVPQLAESLEESDDRLTWTLKLRDGVRFSDGTPVNADAVLASLKRYNDKGGLYASMYTYMVKDAAATDESTVEFSLARPWGNFPALMARGHGMVVAPSSVQGDQFTPIGAGPFEVSNLRPNQLVEMRRNDDYWGGAAYLDGLRFVAITGDQPKLEALETGGVDMIYLRSAHVVDAAKDKFPGLIDTNSMTMVGQINSDTGRPGADPRIRQAMAYGVSTDIIKQRAGGSLDMAGTDLFQPFSEWHGETTGVTPDAATAKKLLDEAKADGYDGKLTYVGMGDPDSRAVALAVQAQLNAVGFDTEIVYSTSVPDQLRRLYADRNFDLARGAYNVSDIDPEIRLFNSMHSSTDNLIGLHEPEVDKLLDQVLAAPDADSKRAALNSIQQYVNDEQPFLTWGAGRTYVAWADDVHGVKPSLDEIILFDKTFSQN